jgi:hypothetical protein
MIAKFFTLATLLIAGQAYGQATIETSLDFDSKVMDYVKKHFSAAYHGEVYGVRRDTESEDKSERNIKDFRIMHNPTLIFKPIENWSLLSTAEFKYSDQNEIAGASFPNSFYRALVTLTRSNVLTEKENGLKLDLGVGRRQFNTGSAQLPGGQYALASYGNNRVFANLSKKLGTVDASLLVQYLHNDYKKTTSSTWKHSAEFIPTLNIPITANLSYFFNDDIILNTAKTNDTDREFSITHEMNFAVFTYQWSDKISTYYQMKYLHIESFSAGFQSQDDSMEHYTGLTYAITPKNTVTFEVGSELAHARDGRDGFSKKITYPEVAMYVDLAI